MESVTYSECVGNVYDVVVVDDHPLIRLGIEAVLNALPNYRLVGEAENGKAAIELIKKERPNIVLLDIELPEMNGLEVMAEIKKWCKPTKIVILTNYLYEKTYNCLIASKVDGIILKQGLLEEIKECLVSVAAGMQYIDKSCYAFLNKQNSAPSKTDSGLLGSLTKREVEIFKLISQKKTTNEIAEILLKSPKTIENIRYQICRKLNIVGPNSLLTYAIEHKPCFE